MTEGSGGDCRGLPGGGDKGRSGEEEGRGGITAGMVTASTDILLTPCPAPLSSCLCNSLNIYANAIR